MRAVTGPRTVAGGRSTRYQGTTLVSRPIRSRGGHSNAVLVLPEHRETPSVVRSDPSMSFGGAVWHTAQESRTYACNGSCVGLLPGSGVRPSRNPMADHVDFGVLPLGFEGDVTYARVDEGDAIAAVGGALHRVEAVPTQSPAASTTSGRSTWWTPSGSQMHQASTCRDSI